MPMLAIAGSEPDSWRLDEAIAAQRLANVPELARATVAGAGHFVHMERPRETADVLLGFLEP
jgi:pimeloyl-ACP methyl ester carboxylesterase